MIRIDDLTGIPEDKRRQAIECLDDLLTFRDSQDRLSPIISGYNWYTTLPICDSIITLSHIHETEGYKQEMLRDLAGLGYEPQTVLSHIRDKAGMFSWNPTYRIRGDDGKLLPGLRIKDIRTGEYINLEDYTKPLIEYPQFVDSKGYLVAEDQGWELNVPFGDKQELLGLVDLFLRKYGEYIYDENGIKIPETDEEKNLRSPWIDAYRVPMLLLGETALRYADELPHFSPATKIALKENSNEISFVIHKNLERLRNLPHYEQLLRLGFSEEMCLGNKPFLKDVDEIR